MLMMIGRILKYKLEFDVSKFSYIGCDHFFFVKTNTVVTMLLFDHIQFYSFKHYIILVLYKTGFIGIT